MGSIFHFPCGQFSPFFIVATGWGGYLDDGSTDWAEIFTVGRAYGTLSVVGRIFHYGVTGVTGVTKFGVNRLKWLKWV